MCVCIKTPLIESYEKQRKFYQALWKEQEIVTFVEDNKPDLIWSASVNRIYLNALLSRQAYDKFLITAFDLLKVSHPVHSYDTYHDYLGVL